MEDRVLKSLVVAVLAIALAGCAVVRDPLPSPGHPNGQVVFMGWGKIEVCHERDSAGELFSMSRSINTEEVIAELLAGVATVVSIVVTALAL